MPATMETLRKEFEEFKKRRPQEEQDLKKLVEDKAQGCINKAEDFVPPDPKNLFLKELQDISKEVQEKYRGDGVALKFREELNAFLNDYGFSIKTNKTVPKEFQITLLQAASNFDEDGSIVGHLCKLFGGEYRTPHRKLGEKRCCAAAEKIRRLARILLG